MLISSESYHNNEQARRLADRILCTAGVPPHDTYSIWVDEGSVVIHRYRVAAARMINGRPVLTFTLGPGAKPETYATVRTRQGWQDIEHSTTSRGLACFR